MMGMLLLLLQRRMGRTAIRIRRFQVMMIMSVRIRLFLLIFQPMKSFGRVMWMKVMRRRRWWRREVRHGFTRVRSGRRQHVMTRAGVVSGGVMKVVVVVVGVGWSLVREGRSHDVGVRRRVLLWLLLLFVWVIGSGRGRRRRRSNHAFPVGVECPQQTGGGQHAALRLTLRRRRHFFYHIFRG